MPSHHQWRQGGGGETDPHSYGSQPSTLQGPQNALRHFVAHFSNYFYIFSPFFRIFVKLLNLAQGLNFKNKFELVNAENMHKLQMKKQEAKKYLQVRVSAREASESVAYKCKYIYKRFL